MMAMVLHRYGGPHELKYEEMADPVAGPGEVLVRTAATSVNPVDWKMRSGEAERKFPVEFPGVLGRDVAGTVLAVGEGVSGFAEGDRVMALTHRTYAEKVAVKVGELTVVPDDLGIVEAAALPLVLMTGQQVVLRAARPEKGQTLLISGAAGSVGRVAVFVAKQAGAKVIAGVRKRQLKEAQALGADEVVALDDRSAMERVGLLDAVVDLVGHDTGNMLLGKVKQGGRFASVLGPPSDAGKHPTVEVASITAEPDADAMRQLAEAVAAKRLAVPIDRIMPLREAGEAQHVAEKGGIGKILLTA